MRISEEAILTEFKERWADLLGITGLELSVTAAEPSAGDLTGPACFLRLSFHHLELEFAARIVEPETSSYAFDNKILALQLFEKSNPGYAPLIIGEYLSPKRQARCRENGINWIDLSGNAYIRYRSLLIDKTGFSNRRPPARRGRNPFSDKASLILREAFKQKDKSWRVREMARATQLDPGFISRTINELENRGYIERNRTGFKITSAAAVLDDWVAVYNFRKNRELRYFCLATDPGEILDRVRELDIPAGIHCAFTLQAGASLILPGAHFRTVHIYIEKSEDIKFFEERLFLSEVEDGANVAFLLPYYKNCVFRDAREIDGLKVVSDLQLYLDLFHFSERGPEQALNFFDARWGSKFSGRGA